MAVVDVYNTILTNYKNHLMLALTKSNLRLIKCRSLWKSLIYARRCYCTIYHTIREFTNFCNPLQLIWALVTFVMLVLNIFIFIVILKDRNSRDFFFGLLGLEFQVYIVSLFMAYSLSILDRLHKTVSCVYVIVITCVYLAK